MRPVSGGVVHFAEHGHRVAGVGGGVRHEERRGPQPVAERVDLRVDEERAQMLDGQAAARVLVADGLREALDVGLQRRDERNTSRPNRAVITLLAA